MKTQSWGVLTLILGAGVLVYLLAPVITPFAIALFLAYLTQPAVNFFITLGLSRNLASITVFFLLMLAIIAAPLLAVPMIEQQIVILSGKLPIYIDRFQEVFVPWLQSLLGVELGKINMADYFMKITDQWRSIGGFAARLFSTITESGLAMLSWLANLVLIPVVTFYLLRDWNLLLVKLHDILALKYQHAVTTIATEVDHVLGVFIRGQLLVMFSLGLIYALGLWFVGLELGLLIGFIAGLASIVPYLGFILGLLIAGITSIIQTQDSSLLIPVLIVFSTGQLLESFLLTPYLIGDSIGLHPVAVIFAVMAGGQLFGFIGVLLALPIAAVTLVLLRHVYQTLKEDLNTNTVEGPSD